MDKEQFLAEIERVFPGAERGHFSESVYRLTILLDFRGLSVNVRYVVPQNTEMLKTQWYCHICSIPPLGEGGGTLDDAWANAKRGAGAYLQAKVKKHEKKAKKAADKLEKLKGLGA